MASEDQVSQHFKVNMSDACEKLKKYKLKAGNKMCFDCNAMNPTWASPFFGVFLCLECSALHRRMGVHITFVRSAEWDTWATGHYLAMVLGGNDRATSYFKQHGWVVDSANKAEAKYTSRAAVSYKALLEKEVRAEIKRQLSSGEAEVSIPHEPAAAAAASAPSHPTPTILQTPPEKIAEPAPAPEVSASAAASSIIVTETKSAGFTKKAPIKKKGGLGAVVTGSGGGSVAIPIALAIESPAAAVEAPPSSFPPPPSSSFPPVPSPAAAPANSKKEQLRKALDESSSGSLLNPMSEATNKQATRPTSFYSDYDARSSDMYEESGYEDRRGGLAGSIASIAKSMQGIL